PEIGDVNDVLVADLRRSFGFDQKALGRSLVALRVFDAQYFDRDSLVDDRVASRVDRPHPALAEERLDQVAPINGGSDERILPRARIRWQACAVTRAELHSVRVMDVALRTRLHDTLVYHIPL